MFPRYFSCSQPCGRKKKKVKAKPAYEGERPIAWRAVVEIWFSRKYLAMRVAPSGSVFALLNYTNIPVFVSFLFSPPPFIQHLRYIPIQSLPRQYKYTTNTTYIHIALLLWNRVIKYGSLLRQRSTVWNITVLNHCRWSCRERQGEDDWYVEGIFVFSPCMRFMRRGRGGRGGSLLGILAFF